MSGSAEMSDGRRFRPIMDGVVVRLEPSAERVGSVIIPDNARADAGTYRAQREAKIGVVVAIGDGRRRKRRTDWERDARKTGPLKPDEIRLMWDGASEGSAVPMDIAVGDRVLFDPRAELREVDPGDPLLRCGAAFQVAAVLGPS